MKNKIKETLSRGALVVSTTVSSCAFAVTTALAEANAGGDLVTKVNTMADNIYKAIAGVVLAVGGAALAVCVLKIMFSSDDNTVGASIKWAKRIIAAIIIILIMATIIKFIAGNIVGTNASGLSLL